MTIEEKLQHFYDISTQEAAQEASRAVTEHKQKLEAMFSQHKAEKRQNAEAELKAEAQNAKREVNKALSAEQLSIKRDWTRKHNELKEKLFVEVKNQLEQFMTTPRYEDYLCKKIKEAVDFAGEDEIFIYLTPADSGRVRSLVARTGFPLRVAEEAFMGGIKAAIPSKNILIDNSFLERFQTLRRDFEFEGGQNHE